MLVFFGILFELAIFKFPFYIEYEIDNETIFFIQLIV